MLITMLRLMNLVLTYGIFRDFRDGVHFFIFKPPYIRHRVNPEFIGSRNIAYRWRSLPRVRRLRAAVNLKVVPNDKC